MTKVSNDKYLGDIVSNDGKMDKNIKMRESKGYSASSQILTILKTVSLGNHYFYIAKLMRNAALVNKVLVNSEVWYPINETNLKSLVRVDEIFMRKIFEVCESTPKESLYLELGLIPIDDIVKCRRIMYLHYILTQDKNQLLYKFFQAQMRNPSKGDWTEIVKQDLIDFNISQTFDEISKMKVQNFKVKVKKACKIYTFNKLIAIKNRHEKNKHIEYSKLETSKYLLSNMFSVTQSRILFKLRTRMLDVKANLKKNIKIIFPY